MLIKLQDKRQSEFKKAVSQNDVDDIKFLKAYQDNLEWFSKKNKEYLPSRLDFELYHNFRRGVNIRDMEKQYGIPKYSVLQRVMVVLRAVQRSKV